MFILKRITTQGRVCRLAETAPEVAKTSNASGAVVDLRALFDTARTNSGIDPEMRRLIMSCDVFLYL